MKPSDEQPVTPEPQLDAAIPTANRNAQLRRVALSSLLGTIIEYYDFLLYSTMAALVFGRLFFPSSNPALSTIAAFGTLAAGYVASGRRPGVRALRRPART